VGVGKTCLAQLIPKILPKELNITLVSCRNIAFEYSKTGAEVIDKYASIPKICFDDLGVEAPGRYYGKDCNTIAEVILSRHEKFIRKKTSTYNNLHTIITTNLNATEIEKRYGERVRSRIREMFNLITFSKKAKDKRS
jgi:DNA replication protein DnaC